MRLLVLVVLGLAVLALPAPASAKTAALPPTFQIGIGDQKTTMFTDPLFSGLGLRTARIVVAWDILTDGGQKADLDRWMAAAKAARIKPLVVFGRSRLPGRARVQPTPKALLREFRRLRARYPFATDWSTWNEGNHCSQPFCRDPAPVARYFDGMTRACPSCRILGASVLDQPNMVAWVTRFQRLAKEPVRFWGLHNYLDANRFRTSGTRALLSATRGEVWFTETGGIVKRRVARKIAFPESAAHAARATRWVFDELVPLSPRIKRVYLYHWDQGSRRDSWDSALVTVGGRPRPAYRVLKARVKALAAARAAAQAP